MIAFLFPGQGSQYVGMGKELYEASQGVREICSEARESVGWDVASLSWEGPAEVLNQTAYTQPALLTWDVAFCECLKREGVSPDFVAGHSVGEYAAVVAAGGILFRDACALVAKRGRLMQEAVPNGQGMMAAIVGLPREQVEEICQKAQSVGIVVAANFNCPGQVVISGGKGAVEEAIQLAHHAGAGRVIPLPVSVPSHSPLMEKAQENLSGELEKVLVQDLSVPLVTNWEARCVRAKGEVREALTHQLSAPVLWEDAVRVLIREGVETFIEVGPGRVLSGLMKRIDRSVRIFNCEDCKSCEETIERVRGA